MTTEFTGYERPRWLALRSHLSAMEIRGGLTFDPVLQGTRMRWSWAVAPRRVVKLLTPLVARTGRRQEQAIWDNLKRVLEAQQAPAAAAGR